MDQVLALVFGLTLGVTLGLLLWGSRHPRRIRDVDYVKLVRASAILWDIFKDDFEYDDLYRKQPTGDDGRPSDG